MLTHGKSGREGFGLTSLRQPLAVGVLESISAGLRRSASRIASAYLRHSPGEVGRRSVWHFTNQHLTGYPFDFVQRLPYGLRITGNTRDLISLFIYYFGVWEPVVTRFIQSRLRRGDGFIDVGANIGYYTALASRLVGDTGKVVAIEASPLIFEQLQTNLVINSIRNVRAINQAATDHEGAVVLYEGATNNRGRTTTLRSWAERYNCTPSGEVAGQPLHQMISADEWRITRIVKIDVEGGEWTVLSGFLPALPQLRSDAEVIIEVTPTDIASQGGSARQLADAFAAYGFHPYKLANAYTPTFYLESGRVARAERLDQFSSEQTDVVFSRVNAEYLEI